MNRLFVLLLTLQLIYGYVTAVAIPGNNTRNHEDEAFGNSTAEAHFSTKLVTNDVEWCDNHIAGVPAGAYKPVAAVCDYDVPYKFSVTCQPQTSPGDIRTITGWCPRGSNCFQRNDVTMWNGHLGTDVDCQ